MIKRAGASIFRKSAGGLGTIRGSGTSGAFMRILVRAADGRFVGEVNFHRTKEEKFYEMGVVVEKESREKGYGKKALEHFC